LLAREGIQPIHDSQRGPVAPIQDPRYPLGGDLGGGDPAAWKIIHDAGSAFVVWVHGSERWITGYIDTLPESVSDESFDGFLKQVAQAAKSGDGSLRSTLSQAVLASFAITADDVRLDIISEPEDFLKEGAITAPEIPVAVLIDELKLRGKINSEKANL